MKLLVPIDIEHPTDILDLAAYTAERLGAEVQLFSVVPPGRAEGTFQPYDSAATITRPPAGDSTGGRIPVVMESLLSGPIGTMVETHGQAVERARTVAREHLDAFTGRFPDSVVTTAATLGNHPGAAIAAHATAEGVDLVVMRTHGRGGLSRAVMGSVAEAVVRTADLPVMLVGPAYLAAPQPHYDEFIACVDGSPLSEEILPIAAFVRTLGMRVTVVTAVSSGHSADGAQAKEQYVGKVAAGLREQGVEASSTLIPGIDPVAAIVSYVSERPRAIVALTTHARSGLPRLVLGSVAMRVVHESPNPVLVLHGKSGRR